MLTKAWQVNDLCERGIGSTPNTCNDLTVRLLSNLGLTVDPSIEPLMQNSAEFYTSSSDAYTQKINILLSTKLTDPAETDPSKDWQRIFDISESEPTLLGDSKDAIAAAASCAKARKRDCKSLPADWSKGTLYDDAITQAENNGFKSHSTPLPIEKLLRTMQQEANTAVQPFDKTIGQPGTATIGKAAQVGLGRTGGAITAVAMVAYDIAKSLGESLGPLLITLDLIDGNWVGAGMGIIGTVLGAVASMAVAGPIGWIIGGAIAAFFAILPLAWQHKHIASISDRQGILQYAFFGDSSHTGNEQCQSMGNSNCTAVFGPGVLSLVFGWNNFDSIAFLINYNQGYAMTLSEIATSFYNVDDPANKGKGTQQIATIKCNNNPGRANAFGGWQGDDPSKCNRPTFQLNRDLITLPILNQPASLIYNRIIPAPGGDCKLINDAANALTVPEYNMTITGQPVAIACNLSAAEIISGTVIPLDPSNHQPATNISSGNSSTDGQNGHQIAVPPPTPFQNNLINSTNGVCLSGSGGSMCLAQGTYDIQRGSQNFDSSKVDTVTVPPSGGSISWYEIGQSSPHSGPTRTLRNYTTDQSPPQSKFFANAMSSAPTAGANGYGAPFNISTGSIPSPPLICLFTKTDHNGDVGCYGPGGGNVSESMSGKAKSIAVKGGATAVIYAESYGDVGGAVVTSDVMDLSQEVYGSGGDFSERIVAMWVCEGGCA